jgi:type II secretion system protein F
MPSFKYVAVDATGAQVTGELQAADVQEATQRLRDSGSFPMEISEAAGAAKSGAVGPRTVGRRKKVGRGDVAIFTRQLADLISAGMPLDRGLTVLIEQAENSGMRDILSEALQEVRGGEALSAALAKNQKVFGTMYTNMLRAGEASGQLAEVGERMADFLEREQTRRSQLMTALAYPGVILTVSLLAVFFLLTVVVPKLSHVFKDMGDALPTPTVILLAVTGFLSHYWYTVILGVAGIALGFRMFLSTAAGKKQFDSITMKLPIVGPLVTKVVVSRFARAFGTLMSGGVPLLESLDIAGDACGNIAFNDNVSNLIESAKQGENLADGMKKAGRFPPILIHMTAVGEETGDLPRMLGRVSNSMDFEVDAAMRRMTTMLEPMIVLGVGGFVGFVVLSILLPIFSANTAVK